MALSPDPWSRVCGLGPGWGSGRPALWKDLDPEIPHFRPWAEGAKNHPCLGDWHRGIGWWPQKSRPGCQTGTGRGESRLRKAGGSAKLPAKHLLGTARSRDWARGETAGWPNGQGQGDQTQRSRRRPKQHEQRRYPMRANLDLQAESARKTEAAIGEAVRFRQTGERAVSSELLRMRASRAVAERILGRFPSCAGQKQVAHGGGGRRRMTGQVCCCLPLSRRAAYAGSLVVDTSCRRLEVDVLAAKIT